MNVFNFLKRFQFFEVTHWIGTLLEVYIVSHSYVFNLIPLNPHTNDWFYPYWRPTPQTWHVHFFAPGDPFAHAYPIACREPASMSEFSGATNIAIYFFDLPDYQSSGIITCHPLTCSIFHIWTKTLQFVHNFLSNKLSLALLFSLILLFCFLWNRYTLVNDVSIDDILGDWIAVPRHNQHCRPVLRIAPRSLERPFRLYF